MNKLEKATLEECMRNFIRENEMKNEDIVKGFREKCPICGIETYKNNYLEASDQGTAFFTCSYCGFEKQIFYNIDIEDKLVYRDEKVVYNPMEDELYNSNVKADIILKWGEKKSSSVSFLKLNKSQIKHLKALLSNSFNLYKDLLNENRESIVIKKKIKEVDKLINKLNSLG